MYVMWAVMMVAMMVPSAAPMVLIFAAVYRKRREQGGAFVSTGVFLTGYLVVCERLQLGGGAVPSTVCSGGPGVPDDGDHGALARRVPAFRCRGVPVHAAQGGLPGQVPHAHGIHHD